MHPTARSTSQLSRRNAGSRRGVRRCLSALLAVATIAPAVVVAAATSASAATTLPSGFVETEVAHPLPRPTAMAISPAGDRVFITLQGGQLMEVKNGTLLSTPVITLPVDSNGERGLDGVALDPAFATNGYIYLYYTATTPVAHNRVSRFTVVGDTASPATETVLLDIDPLSSLTQHNGGAIHFGADGKLYIAVGDNQSSANAQDMSTLKGKVLRINPNGSIPTDNPFYATATGNNRAIWLLGFRNPFTFAVQPGTGRTFINDVGSDFFEEINDGIAGSNYGWPNTEGYTSDPAYRSPLYAYAHGDDSNTGCAITGGDFYNPTSPQFPSNYVGMYFFLDFCNGWIKTLDPATNAVADFAQSIHTYPVGLTTGPDGSIYYLANGADGVGSLWKISYTGSLAPSIGSQPQSTLVSQGYPATFGINASGYQPLTYQWYRNNVIIPDATSASYTTPPTTTADNGAQFKAVVTNSFGQATSNSAVLSVTTAQPPVPTIASPVSGTTWNAGDTIAFSGSATDPQDGALPASDLTWRVDFGHHEPGTPNAHFHPFVPSTSGVSHGLFVIPTSGETDPDVYYRITLTATDSAGLTTTIYRDIHPNLSTITLASVPSGLLTTVEGRPVTTPYTVQSVVGMTRTIGAPSPQTLGWCRLRVQELVRRRCRVTQLHNWRRERDVHRNVCERSERIDLGYPESHQFVLGNGRHRYLVVGIGRDEHRSTCERAERCLVRSRRSGQSDPLDGKLGRRRHRVLSPRHERRRGAHCRQHVGVDNRERHCQRLRAEHDLVDAQSHTGVRRLGSRRREHRLDHDRPDQRRGPVELAERTGLRHFRTGAAEPRCR